MPASWKDWSKGDPCGLSSCRVSWHRGHKLLLLCAYWWSGCPLCLACIHTIVCNEVYIYTYMYVCIYRYLQYMYCHSNDPFCMYLYVYLLTCNHRRKFSSQTSDNMDRWKAEMGRVREEKRRRKKIKKRKSPNKEDPGARKGRKVARHSVFPMICGSGGSKSRLAKGAGAGQLARWGMKNCPPLWREAHFQVKMYKAPQLRRAFWSWDVKKCTPLWREAHFEVKVQRTDLFRALLEVEMSKKCTPLWREAHFEVKSVKNWPVQSTFGSWDVEKMHAVAVQSTFRSQKWKKLTGSEHFLTFRCGFAWQAQGIVHLVKVSKTWGFCGISKNDGRRGHLKRICKDAFLWQVQCKRHVHQSC